MWRKKRERDKEKDKREKDRRKRWRPSQKKGRKRGLWARHKYQHFSFPSRKILEFFSLVFVKSLRGCTELSRWGESVELPDLYTYIVIYNMHYWITVSRRSIQHWAINCCYNECNGHTHHKQRWIAFHFRMNVAKHVVIKFTWKAAQIYLEND